jgi:hypothetical protein
VILDRTTLTPLFVQTYAGSALDWQNLYDVWFTADSTIKDSSASLGAKLSKIEQTMNEARADTAGSWYFNSLSGATHMTPVDAARATNQKAYELIGVSIGTKQTLGVMQMDFPAERLVYRIIKSNFAGPASCSAKTFRGTDSNHSYVEFNMPANKLTGTVITVPGGAYDKSSGIICNRVVWRPSAISRQLAPCSQASVRTPGAGRTRGRPDARRSPPPGSSLAEAPFRQCAIASR